MNTLARAAAVAQLEQHLEHGQNWDSLLARLVEEVCDPELRADLAANPDLYAELELLVFESIADELQPT